VTTQQSQIASTPTREAAIRNYEYFSFAALLVVVLILFERGSGLLWVMVPFLIGLGGIAGRWRLALPLFLLACTYAIAEGMQPVWLQPRWRRDPFSDWLLAAAVLGYAAGQARLQGATRSILPPDPRQVSASSRELLEEPGRHTNYMLELAVLGLSLLVWAALAPWLFGQLPRAAQVAIPGAIWEVLAPHVGGNPPTGNPHIDLQARVWRLVVLAWTLILGAITCRALLAFLARGRRRPEEALMFLQDSFWRDTRGEQRRLFRWLAWARLRAERRRKEQS
jgi:hypothetical protein